MCRAESDNLGVGKESGPIFEKHQMMENLFEFRLFDLCPVAWTWCDVVRIDKRGVVYAQSQNDCREILASIR